ncbi:MAG: hypothetical protein GWO10_06690 [candidate division Zixibacteria bacterium]|nr:hypothetical protein [candidate division Zixibacteria bacterium]NIX58309.1 hypothetical protein [candidate division Zixibacteria bacterium]
MPEGNHIPDSTPGKFAGQPILLDIEVLHFGKISQRLREVPTQVIPAEVYPDDPAIPINLYSIPTAGRVAAAPPAVVGPAGSARRLI